MTTDHDYLQKKNTILFRALALSGAINILVLCLLSYWIIRERPPTPYCELKPQKKDQTNKVVDPTDWAGELVALHSLSFNQLVSQLESNKIIGNAYREKDIALACLIDFHDFDLQRALLPQNLPLDKHLIRWTPNSDQLVFLSLYPNLKQSDFQHIIQFAKTERWPLTAKGLFLQLQKQLADKQNDDPTLIEAFAMTSEFWTMELLLNRGDTALNQLEIAQLIAQGNWQILSKFIEQQRENHDLSDERRREVLFEYVKVGSQAAAQLLVVLEKEYILTKADDGQIISILELLSQNNAANELFAKELLMSPRSKPVWQNAASLLYQFAGEKKPEIWNYQNIVTRFISSPAKKTFQPFPVVNSSSSSPQINTKPTATLLQKTKPLPLKKNETIIFYCVQKGDTLWKISKKFKVNIETIKKINQLSSDIIKPGKTLKIPDSKPN